jgi:hypothetical protein
MKDIIRLVIIISFTILVFLYEFPPYDTIMGITAGYMGGKLIRKYWDKAFED